MGKKQKTKPASASETSQEIVMVDGQEVEINRDNLGQFAKGVSGNPQGRPKGSKNRTVILKQAMEEALTRTGAENFTAIVDQAIKMAIGGDKDMIKFILGDVLKEVRRSDSDDEESKKIGKIEISFSPYTGPQNDAKDAIEAEFSAVEEHTSKSRKPSP